VSTKGLASPVAVDDSRSQRDLLRALYRTARGRKGRGLGFEDLVQAASNAAGKPMEEFFQRHITGTGVLPLPAAAHRGPAAHRHIIAGSSIGSLR
jgi:predicted metalloprotease with PDZ domain